MVKEYTHTVNVIHEVKPLRPDFAVLSGFEDQILPGLLAGSDGAISGLSNVAPEPFVNLVRSAREGGLRTARPSYTGASSRSWPSPHTAIRP